MVNFHDPVVVTNDLCECAFGARLRVTGHSQNSLSTVAFVKLSHTLVGLYMWVCHALMFPEYDL
jgi:hypothetical protein